MDREIIADVLNEDLPWLREDLLELADKIIVALTQQKKGPHPEEIAELDYMVDWQSYKSKNTPLGIVSIIRDMFEKINEIIRFINKT